MTKKCPPSPWCFDKTINVPTLLTIVKALLFIGVGAFTLYGRIVNVEAQANANAKKIAEIQKDVATIGRVEEGMKNVLRTLGERKSADEYQNRRIDDIYKLLMTLKKNN